MSGCAKMTRICASVGACPCGLVCVIQSGGRVLGTGDTAANATGGGEVLALLHALKRTASEQQSKKAGHRTARRALCMDCLPQSELGAQRPLPVARPVAVQKPSCARLA